MSFKIAAATGDGENINLHFGAAEDFLVLEYSDEGELLSSQSRAFVVDEVIDTEASDLRSPGTGCGGGGCSGGGCGGGTQASSRIKQAAKFIADCDYLLAAGIGPGAERTLHALGINSYQITGNIFTAAEKILAFRRRFKINLH